MAAAVPVGRRYTLPPVRVDRRQIRDFAAAVGEQSPACHEVVAARAAGYPDLVAPPTFVAMLTLRMTWCILADPATCAARSVVLQRSQHIAHRHPAVAGQLLSCRATIMSAADIRGTTVLTIEHQITASNTEICTGTTILILTGGVSQ